MLTAIIVAGGSSQRMGFDKTFALLGGKPVIAHSLAAFEQSGSVAGIIIVGRAGRLAELTELALTEGCRKVTAILAGGLRRQDSVACGLARLPEKSEFVAIHDAARPLVRPELIEAIFALAQTHGGAASAAPVIDTLKRTNAAGEVIGGVERAQLFGVQTPQIFRRELLEEAYRAVSASGIEITDEISALEHMQRKVVLLPNEKPNFKITYSSDLILAEALLARR